MMTPKILRARFRRLVAAEGLSDLDPYFQKDFCDSVPLYSRYRQIGFIEEFGRDGADRILLGMGIDYMDSIVDSGGDTRGMVIALTIDSFDKSSPIIPRIYVCNPDDAAGLPSRLGLRSARSPLGPRMQRMLSRLPGADAYQLFEEVPRRAGTPRVFVGRRPDAANDVMSLERLVSVGPATVPEAGGGLRPGEVFVVETNSRADATRVTVDLAQMIPTTTSPSTRVKANRRPSRATAAETTPPIHAATPHRPNRKASKVSKD